MRLTEPVGLSGITTWLPDSAQTAERAVAEGLVDADTAADLGYSALPVEPEAAPPRMAVLAARDTLRRTGTDPADIGLVLHAWMHYQGHDLWSPAHYVADRIGAHDGLPLGIQQVCNGGAAAIETAIARLVADPDLELALVTTADRFPDSAFDRWSGDYGIGYGDGATSVLLHRAAARRPDLYLHALESMAAPRLERMHRGRDPFGTAPRSVSERIDIRRTKKAYFEEGGKAEFSADSRSRLQEVVRRCLAAGGVDGADPRLRHVVLPRLGRTTLEEAYVKPLSEVTSAPALLLGETTGHLGAGDAAAGLADLVPLLAPGDHALVVSAGAGFTWSCLLVSG
ncbi:3-oxoacyl-ACP synthase [Nocardiopsis aegyptia]|uniref:3-oxoacyl-[acyl-carrier-protein] synthase-3 n=1 Tax=Nocardiopsis aegyptia TaxID=220378 RepID=A0A7Z0EP11_9ACTN|nr:3-oxoacyl-ACP synthase [Nocardiopsis aegyptia]NYJ35594.1 3-oxoacyl-[acyl-carrier-protein] synthase-3 [Nocardiopsis aegyptia]